MHIRSISVGPSSTSAVLEFTEAEPLRTSQVPDAVSRALLAAPGLRGHRCDNPGGCSFRDELADTELAHLFEHLTLELMTLAGSPDTLRGETHWDFAHDGWCVFHVKVEYDDDLVCVGALKAAGEFVQSLIAGVEPPDLRAESKRLRELRRS